MSVVDRRDEERSSSRVNCSIRSALCRRMPIGMGWRAGTAGGAAVGGGVGSANQTNNKIGENNTGNTKGTGKGKWAVEETSRARMGPGRVEGRGSMHGNGGGIGRFLTEGGFSWQKGKKMDERDVEHEWCGVQRLQYLLFSSLAMSVDEVDPI